MVKILSHQKMKKTEEPPGISQQIDQEMQRIYQEITEEGKESQICGWEGSQRSVIDVQARKNVPISKDLTETNEDSSKIHNNGSKFSLKTENTTTNSATGLHHDGVHSYRLHCGHNHDDPVSPSAGASNGPRAPKVKQPTYMVQAKMEWLRKQNLNRFLERMQKRIKNGKREKDKLRSPSPILHEAAREKALRRALNSPPQYPAVLALSQSPPKKVAPSRSVASPKTDKPRIKKKKKSIVVQADAEERARKNIPARERTSTLDQTLSQQRGDKQSSMSITHKSDCEATTPAPKDASTVPGDHSRYSSPSNLKEPFRIPQANMAASGARHLEIEMFEENVLFGAKQGAVSHLRSQAGVETMRGRDTGMGERLV